MESRELSTLNKAEKLIALLKEDKELREKLNAGTHTEGKGQEANGTTASTEQADFIVLNDFSL